MSSWRGLDNIDGLDQGSFHWPDLHHKERLPANQVLEPLLRRETIEVLELVRLALPWAHICIGK